MRERARGATIRTVVLSVVACAAWGLLLIHPAYADTRKRLHVELDRLRAELKVPPQDPPGSIIPAPKRK